MVGEDVGWVEFGEEREGLRAVVSDRDGVSKIFGDEPFKEVEQVGFVVDDKDSIIGRGVWLHGGSHFLVSSRSCWVPVLNI